MVLLTNVQFELTPTRRGGFYAKIGVGSKYVLQTVYVDTGSTLFWINCQPCAFSIYMPEPIFDPRTSSTFAFDDCDGNICKGTRAISCGYDQTYNFRCEFVIEYADGSSCSGRVAREQFAFGEEVLQGIFFGCSYKTKLVDTSGILGLAEHSSSLLTQLGYRRFGYCIGDVADMSYSYHKLFIGNSVTITGDKTSLIVDSKYYINVERIEVGGLLLDIDRDIFKKKDHTGGMVVDNGSPYTFMPLVAVKSFETALIKMFTKANFTINKLHSYRGYQKLCYDGDVKKDLDLQSFPPVKLTFEGGATMELIAENVFHQVSESSFCLGTLPIEVIHEDATISILGFHMQQQFYVSFDLDRKEFAFTRMDCETWS
ncbi:PREDICTED: aspartic proteinase nepenthesin-2-like [Erythranthe guttata]|uniref:aspartic proteinase nepenthesin-2-like n=1 Tax=Erythranthe guttata TaxID=4155 RepID=UPI00064DD1E5|nr:PREDICTED: aspartic proteinase nepenthesin-2-like [Erythranthe guttata]|eukprot:XP_012837562.1 PREDICTED: aspartic proteinase nepenthesin-2-like [Erythranthe guttata]